ncbi:MAG: PIN domain-containing protein [Lachnospiraceae bacterium]|nr:PIN domain-containing protein [Lachnospiraceae bacterium]
MADSGKVYLDANAILRYVLKDNEEQFNIVKECVNQCCCVAPLEVMAEVAYVLEGVYSVPRNIMIRLFRKLACEVWIINQDVLFRALEIYDDIPKLDFVDCLMYGYHVARNADVLTYDKKMMKRINLL